MKFFKSYGPNPEGRDFVVSDLHGCYEDFKNLLYDNRFDPNVDRVFSVGDLVDRGPDSLSCLKLMEEEWFFPVLGNHEIMWLAAHKYWMEDYDPATDDVVQLKTYFHIFMQNGGSIIDNGGAYLRFKKIIEKLPSIIEVNHKNGKKFGVLHAELPIKFTDWSLLYKMTEDQMSKDLADNLYWGRSRFTSRSYLQADLKKILNVDRIYVGHTIVEKVTNIGNVRYIDTGSFLSTGKITVELME